MDRVVVVGGSLAGLRACETLRSEGFAGTITLVAAEPEVPYDRPPLSKKFLAGEWDADRIRLRKPEAFAELALDLRTATRAVSLDTAARRITVENHAGTPSREGYDALIIATGTRTRRLADQPAWPGVHELRTLADATALRADLAPGARVVVIGAGFIGLEVAATARQRGCHVTVVEGAPAPLMRGLGQTMGAAVANVHQRNGVSIHCGMQVRGLVGDERGVRAVTLADAEGGERDEPCDVVIVGIGVVPAVDWLDGSGVHLADGVRCDATLAAHGVGDVWAAGDCAHWPNRVFGDPATGEAMRVEHWTNAAEQGAHAARNVMAAARGAEPVPFESVPFFWSDQFDSRIQFVGRAHGNDDTHVFAGDPSTGPCAVLYGYDGRLRGVLGVSMPKLVMPFRALIARRATWAEALETAATLG